MRANAVTSKASLPTCLWQYDVILLRSEKSSGSLASSRYLSVTIQQLTMMNASSVPIDTMSANISILTKKATKEATIPQAIVAFIGVADFQCTRENHLCCR